MKKKWYSVIWKMDSVMTKTIERIIEKYIINYDDYYWTHKFYIKFNYKEN